MADLIIREHAPGRWIVGRPTVRDGRVHVTGRTRWASNALMALRAAGTALGVHDTHRCPEASEPKRATHREPNPDRLRPQARQILHHLILRRGLTARMAMQVTPPCFRLAARVAEIRAEFGADSVETVYQTSGGTRFARYVWRGPDSVQLDME